MSGGESTALMSNTLVWVASKPLVHWHLSRQGQASNPKHTTPPCLVQLHISLRYVFLSVNVLNLLHYFWGFRCTYAALVVSFQSLACCVFNFYVHVLLFRLKLLKSVVICNRVFIVMLLIHINTSVTSSCWTHVRLLTHIKNFNYIITSDAERSETSAQSRASIRGHIWDFTTAAYPHIFHVS